MKIEKAQAGYIHRDGTQYTCDDCVMLKALNAGSQPRFGCAYFGREQHVSPMSGSCNYFAPGDRGSELPWLDNFTKMGLGYLENRMGFSCKRCENFDPKTWDCSVVNKKSAGADPGMIHPNSCCDFWKKDPSRGVKRTDELIQILNGMQRNPRQMGEEEQRGLSADEYRELIKR